MTISDERIRSAGHNIQEKAALIWNVANTLFGAFKPHEYGLVILPMVVVKRFHDCLLPTHQAVLDAYRRVERLAVKDGFLRRRPATSSTIPAPSRLKRSAQTRRTSTKTSGPI